MGYIRIFHSDDFDHTAGTFTDVALLKSSDGGISVVDVECVHASGEAICAHIRAYYQNPGPASEPPIYLELPPEYLPGKCEFVRRRSWRGDECHTLIKGLSHDEMLELAKTVRRNVPLNRYSICDEHGGARELTIEDMNEKAG